KFLTALRPMVGVSLAQLPGPIMITLGWHSSRRAAMSPAFHASRLARTISTVSSDIARAVSRRLKECLGSALLVASKRWAGSLSAMDSLAPERDAKVRLLSGVPLFSPCAKHELRRIAALVHEVEASKGKTLVREGDQGAEFFVVVAGSATVT